MITNKYVKMSLVTALTVIAGHSLVKFLSPTAEELLEVHRHKIITNYNLIRKQFQKIPEEKRGKYSQQYRETHNMSNFDQIERRNDDK